MNTIAGAEVRCGSTYDRGAEFLELETDVVVVGSGASGAVVARTMAEAGHRVLVLEEGPYIPPEVHGALRPSESLRYAWRGGGLTAAFGLGNTPAINVTMGRCVGGSSVLTGGVCFRIPAAVLDYWQKHRGLTEYSERTLEACYREVEERIHVEEVPRDMQSRSTSLFVTGANKLGIQTKPIRRNTEGCNGCGRCNFGCPEAAKLSVDISYLPQAAASGAEIWSDFLVHRVLMKGNRAVGVEGQLLNGKHGKPNTRVTVRARRVVLTAGAAHTPLILRRSFGGAGFNSPSSEVGKNVTLHPGFRVIARFKDPVNGWKGAMQSVFSDTLEHQRITLVSLFIPPSVLAATMPGVGPAHTERASKVDRLAIFGAIIHDEGGGHIWSNPFGREPVMTYRMAKEDRAAVPTAIRTMASAFLEAGAEEVFLPILGAPGVDKDSLATYDLEHIPSSLLECSSQHPLGSCRMGKTPEHSVVDPSGRVWDTRELYIADGSIVPTSLGVNPQLAIMALATRIAWQMRATPFLD